MKQAIHPVNFGAAIIALLMLALYACTGMPDKPLADDIRHLLPGYITDSIYLSAGNPYASAKARLGRYFFYDRRMSVNLSKSCASCHSPAFAFTDGYRRSVGALGDNVQNNARSLVNIVFNKYLTAADSVLHYPEQQINNPMFHQHPVELGWMGNQEQMLARFKKDSFYRAQMPLLFPGGKDPFTIENIQLCICSFVKSIVGFNAPYDRYVFCKESTAMNSAQVNGMRLFFSAQLRCSSCHGGINFCAPLIQTANGQADYYQNTGLYNVDNTGNYPAGNQGLYEITGQSADKGRFLIPTLRNLAFTAPYMHDGSVASLEEVISIYENGGRFQANGVNRGDGRLNPHKNALVDGFRITAAEKKDLISFLLALSDSTIGNNPQYTNPFIKDETQP